jgi:hypothetical protein
MRLHDPVIVKLSERPPGKEMQVKLVGPLTVSTTVLSDAQKSEVYAVMLYVPAAWTRAAAERTLAAIAENLMVSESEVSRCE